MNKKKKVKKSLELLIDEDEVVLDVALDAQV
jgi:hypothetical protein